jgi:hypothetical protein
VSTPQARIAAATARIGLAAVKARDPLAWAQLMMAAVVPHYKAGAEAGRVLEEFALARQLGDGTLVIDDDVRAVIEEMT